jgi:hypothetical protein
MESTRERIFVEELLSVRLTKSCDPVAELSGPKAERS